MSSRATSIRPPHITIRSSRARAPSYVPPPSPATVSSAIPNVAAPEVDLCGTNRSFCPEPDSKYTTMPRAVLASILSVFPAKSERHKLYSLSSSSTSSVDSFSLPLPASPQQATFGGDVWQKDGHFRTGGRPTARETRLGPLGGVTVRVCRTTRCTGGSRAHFLTDIRAACCPLRALPVICSACSRFPVLVAHHCFLPAYLVRTLAIRS